ncbi:2OG-Fe(II) oxygenase family protein [soil metagenome]
MFHLSPSLDSAAARDIYHREGRVRIHRFLADDCAAMLWDHLRTRDDWRMVLNSGEKVFELDRPTRGAMTPEQIWALNDAVAAGALVGFQYRYESLRVPDSLADRYLDDGLLARFAEFLSSEEVLALLRSLTGATDVVFVDAQATCYGPGDLLTAHDDDVNGKARRAAYVLGLTSNWQRHWGGMLQFHGSGTLQSLTPSFNTLDLFAVPSVHSVSPVAADVPERRLSVTGWLRAQDQPV